MGGWQATEFPMKQLHSLCELPVSRVPIGGLFQNFSFTFRVPQYFLAPARKVSDLRLS